MKELTVEDIKKISIEILRDVHNFCVENNLRYSLAYGSLLGAVRHHGFIPWDDDIDIMMPRPDYDEFVHSYKSKNGFAVISTEIRNSYIPYARAADTTRTIVHSPALWAPKEQGVWIDIFPIDGIEDNPSTVQSKTDKLKILNNEVVTKRFRLALKDGDIKSRIKYLLHNLKDKVQNQTLWQVLDNMNKIRLEVGYKSNLRGIYEIIYKKSLVLPSEVFDKFKLVDFGRDKFMSIDDSDAFLSGIYGDYMQLPPVEERVYKHSAHKYYWK